MSSTYGGQAANVVVPAGIAIASSTNATPIVLVTGAAHGLVTGDEVQIAGHQVNTTANGRWPVVVIDATHVSLTGSGGTGIGGATGSLYPFTLGPALTIPSDGDDCDAASVDVGIESIADRTAMLSINMARYKPAIVVAHPQTDDDTTENTTVASHNFGVASTWEQIGIVSGLLGALQYQDVLDVHVTGSISWGSSCATFIHLLSLFCGFYAAGGGPPAGGSTGLVGWTKVGGSGQRLPTAPSGSGWAGFSLRGQVLVPAGAQSVSVAVAGWSAVGSGASVTILGDIQQTTVAWRPTDFVNRLG